MDDQNKNPKTAQSVTQSTPEVNVEKQTSNQSVSPKTKPHTMTEAEAQALLTINSLQPTKPVKSPKKVYLYISIALILIILIALMSSLAHTSKSSSGNVTLPNSKNNPVNNGGSINSQVRYCSNPINAATVC